MKLRGGQIFLLAITAIALVTLAAWRLNWLSLAEPPSAQSLLVSRLIEISGKNGIDCGTITSFETADFRCIESALEANSPFWFVEELQGIDDFLVIGTASDEKGRVWQISHASFAGRPTTELPDLRTRECATPSIVKSEYPHFSCDGL